jgi:hypothetical protein
MDAKSAKRVDSIYRNIKQFPLLGCLGILIPIIGVLLLPLALLYSSLMSKLLRDYQSGKITVEDHDCVSAQPGDLSTEQKLQFLQYGDTRMWVPYLVGTIWLLLVVFIVMIATMSLK